MIQKLKRRVFQIISRAEEGDRASRVFDCTIMVLIVLSILTIILQSFESLAVAWGDLFKALEVITVAVFTVEYALRLWTADLAYPDAYNRRTGQGRSRRRS